jgi:hypothetical protein
MRLGYPLPFFYRRPPTAGQANTIGRSILQLVVEFLSTTTNRIDMHPCDLGQQGRTTVSHLLGLQGHIPTALLLIQTAEQQVHLMEPTPYLDGHQAVGNLDIGTDVSALLTYLLSSCF